MVDYEVSQARLNILFPVKEPRTAEPLCFNDEIRRFLSNTAETDNTEQKNRCIISCRNDIKPVLQCGLPVCGLVTITMANQVLNRTTDIDSKLDPLTILKTAQSRGYTNQGEMLSVDTLLLLSLETLSCVGRVCTINKLVPSFIMSCVCSNEPILVPYDSDKDHTPFIAKGHQAHWCILVGLVVDASQLDKTHAQNLLGYCQPDTDNKDHFIFQLNHDYDAKVLSVLDNISSANVHVIARHGKSRHLGFWRLDKLCDSNSNLIELCPQRDSQDFMMTNKGLSLKSKFVLLTNEL